MTAPLRHALHRLTWSRRNRWGLVALPLALAAALVGSSDRVQLYFWETGLHRATHGPGGQWVSFRDTYTDSNGPHARRLRVRLDSVRPVGRPWNARDPFELGPGSTAMAVTLTLEADPGLPLSVCHLALRDVTGTRYDYLFGAGGVNQPVSPCVPQDAAGPDEAMGDLPPREDPDARPRPRTWTVSPVIIVPTGAKLTEVDLWWRMPRYLALAVPARPS
jgi:hypothetical protein